MKEKILVLGANSYSGLQFINNKELTKFDLTLTGRDFNIPKAYLPQNLDISSPKKIILNLGKDSSFNIFLEELKSQKFKYIFNFLSMSMVAESWENPQKWYQINLNRTSQIIDTIIENQICEKYIHISTPEVYGNTSERVKENEYFNPSTPYAVSRLAADLHLIAKSKLNNFPYVITRAANVCGPHQPIYRVLPKSIYHALNNIKFFLDGGGTSKRSFIHINDVIEGTLAAAFDKNFYGTVHFSTDEFYTIKELVKFVSYKLDKKYESWVEIKDDRPGKDLGYFLNTDLAKKSLNWRANINLDTIISETINWVKSENENLSRLPTIYVNKD